MYVSERDERAGYVPWAGIVVTVLSLIAMVAVAWALWDSLPELVTTREATERRGALRVPRIVVVGTPPAAVIFLAAILAGSTALADRLRHVLPPPLVASPRSQARSLNVSLVLLPPLVAVVHASVLLLFAGFDFPVERVVGAACGALFAGLGLALPRLVASRPAPGPEWVRWAGGLAMVLVGVGCAAGVFLLPPLPVVVVAALAIGPIVVLVCVLPLAWQRKDG